ncbi:MAG: CBS domain-containing protein [Myxococcales bacterium]|nr:CBS domain-containing protein [Myxococcales bacterium]
MTWRPRLVGNHMTEAPVCVSLEAELEEAVKLMQEHGIRHLPVMDGDDLAGVVTDRDLAMIESLLPEEWERICVAEAMTPEPYTVASDAPLWEVAKHMAREKFGCAVVTDDEGNVIGLFTTTDALRVLADLAGEDEAP